MDAPPKKVLISSEISWDFLRQRHHHLAEHLASQGYQVEFLQGIPARTPPPLDLAKRFFKKISGEKIGKDRATESPPQGIHLRRSLFLPHTNIVFRAWNALLARRLVKHVGRPKFIYLFSNNPSIPEAFSHAYPGIPIIQDVIHNWWNFPWSADVQRRNIRRVLKSCSLIVSDSPLTLNLAKADATDKAAHLMLPAAGPEWHLPSSRHSLLSNGSVIHVLFFGNLRGNSDIEFLNELASAPGIELIGHGLLDATATTQASTALRAVMKPPLDSRSLAELARQVDVIVLPYAEDSFSRTISPAKYFECLASGAMLVSRAALRHLPGWESYVLDLPPAHTSKEFLSKQLTAHHLIHDAQREFAKQHTWDHRFRELMAKIEETSP